MLLRSNGYLEFVMITPAFVVEYRTVGGGITEYCWRSRAIGQVPADGRPTEKNLRRHVEGLAASFQPGEANDHVGKAYPSMRILGANLVRNSGFREVVASVSIS